MDHVDAITKHTAVKQVASCISKSAISLRLVRQYKGWLAYKVLPNRGPPQLSWVVVCKV
jgi:hypothetical protein